jgi:predicted AAA+ superfamily ATPase
MIPRNLTHVIGKSKKSILILGPRQTGKSTLLKSLEPDLVVNLSHEPTYLQFLRNPRELEERLGAGQFKTVFIDEVQRLPSLLNTIQFLIDNSKKPIQFYLSGSSASKLKRGHANLLPGRVHNYFLGPLVSSELGYQMNLNEALSTGTLPGIWTAKTKDEKTKTLESYASTYLKEEIQQEALARGIEGFSRFLFVVAAEAGKFLDVTKFASQAQITRQSAIRYFEILEDTLIVKRCEAFRKSLRRRLTQAPRFFFFDAGVLNGLLGNFTVSADRIGPLFEQFIFNQLFHSIASKDKKMRVSSYRTEHGAEVDFVLESGSKIMGIEVKSQSVLSRLDLRGIKSFQEYTGKKTPCFVVYPGIVSKKVEGVDIVPWQIFLKNIGL